MAQIIVRKLDESVKRRLRERAARAGRSMEEEARLILAEALGPAPASAPSLGDIARSCFATAGLDDDERLLRPPGDPVRSPLRP
jgi:plasmid stability protein